MGPEGLTTEKPMCLQDPFELKHNVCRNLPEKGVRALKSHFGAASHVLSQIRLEEGLVGGINALFSMKVEVDEGENLETSLEAVLVGENEAIKKIFGNPHARPARLPFGGDSVEELVTNVLQNCLLLRSKHRNNGSKNAECNESLKRGLSTEQSVKKRKVEQEEGKIDEHTAEDEDVKLVNDEGIGGADAINEETATGKSVNKENLGEEDAVEEKEDFPNGKGSGPARWQYKQVGGQWMVDGLVWAGRRKKAAMIAEESVVSREAAVTRLVTEEQAMLGEPEVVFTCHLLTTANGQSGTNIGNQSWVALQKVYSRKKSFESMVGWFNPYLVDLVPRLMKEKSSEAFL